MNSSDSTPHNTRCLSRLTPLEQKVAVEFASRIRKSFGERVLEIKIFGSRARREARADSDLDILVLLDRANLQNRNEVSDIGTNLYLEMMLPFLIAPRVLAQADFEKLRALERLFPQEVEKDGIPL